MDHHGVTPGERIGQISDGAGQCDGEGRRRTGRHIADRLEKLGLGVLGALSACPVEREFGDFSVERLAVVEFHPFAECEGDRFRIRRDGPFGGKRRLDRPVLGDPGQSFEHVGVENFIDRGGSACGRVEVRRFEAHSDDEAAGFRLRGRRAGEREGDRQRECCEQDRTFHSKLPWVAVFGRRRGSDAANGADFKPWRHKSGAGAADFAPERGKCASRGLTHLPASKKKSPAV